MKANYYNSNVHVQNGEHGIQPGIFIVENNRVYLVTITPNHRFEVTDEGPLGERYKYGVCGSIEWCGNTKLPGGKIAIYSPNIGVEISNIHNIVDDFMANQLAKQPGLMKDTVSGNGNNEEKQQFTWTDKEDPELVKNGVTILWVAGRTKSLQNFVEKLSKRIGSKCDFSWSAGRAHVECFREAKYNALEAINDEEFMQQFIVPYSKETYDNGTYFEILR